MPKFVYKTAVIATRSAINDIETLSKKLGDVGETTLIYYAETLQEELDKYGDAGWDVFQITEHGDSSKLYYYIIRMKRQVETKTVLGPRNHVKT